MKMLTLDEENKLETFKESLFKSYKNPKLIVLIGCGSFIMCDELNRQWPDIPMILCGERDYTGPKETMIREHALPRTERIPISDLQKKYKHTSASRTTMTCPRLSVKSIRSWITSSLVRRTSERTAFSIY